LDEIKNIILEPGSIYDSKNNVNEETLSEYLISRFGNNYKILIPQLNIRPTWQKQCNKFDQNIHKAIKVLKDIEKNSPAKKLDYIYLLSLEKTDKWERTYQLIKNKI
jgi:hypothetical protein